MNKFEETYLKIIFEENNDKSNQLFSKIILNYADRGTKHNYPFDENEDWNPPYTFNNYLEFYNFLYHDFIKITNFSNIFLKDVTLKKDNQKYFLHIFKTEESREKTIEILTECSNMVYQQKGELILTIYERDQVYDWKKGISANDISSGRSFYLHFSIE